MLLLEVESRVLEQFLCEGLTAVEAEAFRRHVPLHRNLFDNFLFSATRAAVGEGTWTTFPAACERYISLVGDLHVPPPLVPPEVAASVEQVLVQFRKERPEDRLVDGLGSRISEHHHQLAERLFYKLGGDRGDGLNAAGLRVYSKMMSARISDGFVHPALGGHLWSDVPAGPPHLPTGGRSVAVLRNIEGLVRIWRTTPALRPRVERLVLDRAHALGWRTEDPGMIAVSPGRWYADAPPIARSTDRCTSFDGSA